MSSIRTPRTALVCIAKMEDRHINEWIDYHVKLGFSHVYIYMNDWRPERIGLQKFTTLIPWDGEAMQLPAYNHFIEHHWQEYDWAAFFDCDEFLSIDMKKWPYKQPLYKVLLDIERGWDKDKIPYSVAVNWRFFGGSNAYDAGLATNLPPANYETNPSLKTKRLIQSYVNCEEHLDRHVKVMINFNKAKNTLHFINPHCLDRSLKEDVTSSIDGTGRIVHGPWNDNPTECGIQLNHYYAKTKEEFIEKMLRGKADTPKAHPMYNYKESDFTMRGPYPLIDSNAYYFGEPRMQPCWLKSTRELIGEFIAEEAGKTNG